jgi:hypothetical protein
VPAGILVNNASGDLAETEMRAHLEAVMRIEK